MAPTRTVAVGVMIGRGASIAELGEGAGHFDSDVEWHAPGVGGADYATLCGLDGNDPTNGQHGLVDAPPGQKITCGQCKKIWSDIVALKLRIADFK